ncbi:hypothetical protein [Oceanobacillus jeddahense]|uniref:hypothetical protein n=1 Tax=Oceanobacillus jeddahense TaxID=1462527 RepID=UPI000595A605|nr:hypothetical protein [Oceanobacillus jeddahense]
MGVISRKLGTIAAADGTKIEVEETFLTTNPVLYDSIYVVGGTTANQEKIQQDILNFVYETYKYYKPISVAITGQLYIHASKDNNLDGVVFAANNPNFEKDFVSAITKQRFWTRI